MTETTSTAAAAGPSGPRPARLHHHAWVTTDQEATRRFYEDVVGLPLVATWTEVEEFLGGEAQELCHTFFELADGGSLAFFQFADPAFSAEAAAPVPPSLFRHVALLVTAEDQDAIRARAQAAEVGTATVEHGYCTSLYLNDPNGLMLELAVDHPDIERIAAVRREHAHADLDRWLAGDHASNNDWRKEP